VLKKYKEVAALREEVNPLLPLKSSIAAARRLEANLRNLPDAPHLYLEQVGEIIVHLEGELEALSLEHGGEAGTMREI
jgi:hypothetical protein